MYGFKQRMDSSQKNFLGAIQTIKRDQSFIYFRLVQIEQKKEESKSLI